MPHQVSWQFVATKSHPSVHGLGGEAAVAAEAPVGTTSAAPPPLRRRASGCDDHCSKKCRALHCEPPWLNTHDCRMVNLAGKAKLAPYAATPENSDPSGSSRHSHLKRPTGSAATVAVGTRQFSDRKHQTTSILGDCTTTLKLKFSVHTTPFSIPETFIRDMKRYFGWLRRIIGNDRNSLQRRRRGVTSIYGMP